MQLTLADCHGRCSDFYALNRKYLAAAGAKFMVAGAEVGSESWLCLVEVLVSQRVLLDALGEAR